MKKPFIIIHSYYYYSSSHIPAHSIFLPRRYISGDLELKCSIFSLLPDFLTFLTPSFDFQYYMTYKMVYSIDSMHFNYGHVYADF